MSATATPPRTTQTEASRLRPTLFIGLGGTGKEILLRLRRRILQNEWGGRRINDLARFPIASFIYFDTDTTEGVESDRSKRTDPLARAVAFRESERLQKRVDVRHYMSELDNYPHIQSWLPESDLSSINTEHGAGQVRAISRLLFFDQFKVVQGMLRTHADGLLNSIGRQHELSDLNLDIEHELRVVVVCSAAGGTGSGSFIDFGLAVRSMRNPAPQQTDLILLLPGGFKGANYERVNANAFAALMELEHAMRPNTQPPYTDKWAPLERPLANVAPYNDVYLIDSRNVLGAGTNKIDEIYDMVADVLFEDFGSSEFASRKRSISPNQQQFKVVNYLPPLSPKIGEKSMSYSCSYSTFGQATIDTKAKVAVDTAVAQCVQAMLKSYFNVAMADSDRLPTPEERDAFLKTHFALEQTSFHETLPGMKDTDGIIEPQLLERLLQIGPGDSVVANLASTVAATYASQPFRNDLRQLPTLVLRELETRRLDVVGPNETGPAAALVVTARQQLARRLRGDADASLRAALFDFLDRRPRGGLDYTIRLVQDAKDRIEREILELGQIAHRYQARAEAARALFDQSLENLKEAVSRGFPFGPDRRAADRYLEHLRRETVHHLSMLLRQRAAIEAQTLLRDMSDELGVPRGVDAEGRTVWDGAVATLVTGRNAVEKTLAGLDAEIHLLQDAVAREEAGMFVVLPDADTDIETLFRNTQSDIDAWAHDLFEDEGGSRNLFPILQDDTRRANLLAKLRGFATKQIAPRAEKLRSIQDILRAMTPRDRLAVFEKAIVRAMPWLNASFDHLGEALVMADRYKLLIAVEDRTRFTNDFDREIAQVVPTGRLGLRHQEIVNSGLRNRIIIYCELSGLPLDTITPLRSDWRVCYRSELPKAFPLHNHRQVSRFPNPVVPSGAEIDEIRRVMDLFLRSVCFGIVRRADGSEAPYQMHIGMGDWVDIGTERDLRAGGFASANHFQTLSARVEQFERNLHPIQRLAAAALLEWTGKRAYAARMVKIGPNQTDRIPGMIQRVALEAAKRYTDQLLATPNTPPPDPAARDHLLAPDTLPIWTEEIPGSADDTDPMDANRDPNDPPSVRAAPKRRIRPDHFTPEALALLITPNLITPTPQPDQKTENQRAGNQKPENWYIAINREITGPFTLRDMTEQAAAGTLKATTNILPLGAKAWIKARDVPALLDLLTLPPPPPDDDLPAPPADD